MSGTRKIVTIAGARPQFIKAFALSRVLGTSAGFEELLVHTGQHFDENMSEIFFEELRIAPPRYRLSVDGGGHGAATAQMLKSLEDVLIAERPDAVIVYGDTNSTLAGALAASKLGIPLVHIEAGLRSFNRRMPEEINRVIADHVSDLLFCPTAAAAANLEREGIARGVHRVGDLMYDATLAVTPLAERRSAVLDRLGLSPRGYGVATIHRAANTDDAATLAGLLEYLERQARSIPIVFPVHPRTLAALRNAGLAADRQGIRPVEPLGYLDMCKLLHNAAIVLTDSGGVQKEAYFHRVPCVTLRDETEWVETVECGWNRLWKSEEFAPRREIAEYGDGNAARQIVDILRQSL
jgi:UDP-GlcNAc3NAcA epimerase